MKRSLVIALIVVISILFLIYALLMSSNDGTCPEGYFAPLVFDGADEWYGNCEPIASDAFEICRSNSDCTHTCIFQYENMMKLCPVGAEGRHECPGVTGTCEPIANSGPLPLTIPEPDVVDYFLAD